VVDTAEEEDEAGAEAPMRSLGYDQTGETIKVARLEDFDSDTTEAAERLLASRFPANQPLVAVLLRRKGGTQWDVPNFSGHARRVLSEGMRPAAGRNRL